MSGRDEAWESDDEFEQSVLELDQPPMLKPTAIQSPSSSASSFVSLSKLPSIQPRNSSTPLPPAQQLNLVKQKVSNNNKNNKIIAASPVCARESQGNFAMPTPCPSITTISTKRKRRFPGPAGSLPRLVFVFFYFLFFNVLLYWNCFLSTTLFLHKIILFLNRNCTLALLRFI